MALSANNEMTAEDYKAARLLRHCNAIRRNKDVLAAVFAFLNESPPNASAAREAFHEMTNDDQIAIWSVSTTDGGIWETWERDALKYGDLDVTGSWNTWSARTCGNTLKP